MIKPELFSPMPIQVECEENLINLVRELTGIRILDHQLDKFRHTIIDSCQRFNLTSCESYLEALQASSLNSDIQEQLIAGVTVGESYFFRDRAQMDFLKYTILPNLIQKRREQGALYLRIWSAGCSDGQELYSILILLDQLLPDIENWKLHLLGTDINVSALSRALKGVYNDWSLRSTCNSLRDEFFTPIGNQWVIKKSLQRLTKFSYLNLYGDNFPSILSETNAMDLILCRNVFIYFDQSTVSTIMHKFYQSLLAGGYLLQGASDLLDNSHISDFDQHIIENTSYFVRTDSAKHSSYVEIESQATEEDLKQNLVIEINPQIKSKPAVELYQSIEPEFTAPSSTARKTLRESAQIDNSTPIATVLKAYKSIIALLTEEIWNDALQSISKRIEMGDDNALIWQFKAKALANLGHVKEALKACHLSIQHDPQDKHTYFIQALVYMEARRFDKAEESLRRTLYLDRQFVEAHYHMGLLHLLQGKRESGLKYMHNALDISEQADPNRSLHDAAGMNHARMATILRSELRMYQGDK
jgi:chemotaxis protein methyltransferase CheR